MRYFAYILYSVSADRYYVGSAGDNLPERIRKHNANHKGYKGMVSDWILGIVNPLNLKNRHLHVSLK
jgi:putative endonuclease